MRAAMIAAGLNPDAVLPAVSDSGEVMEVDAANNSKKRMPFGSPECKDVSSGSDDSCDDSYDDVSTLGGGGKVKLIGGHINLKKQGIPRKENV